MLSIYFIISIGIFWISFYLTLLNNYMISFPELVFSQLSRLFNLSKNTHQLLLALNFIKYVLLFVNFILLYKISVLLALDFYVDQWLFTFWSYLLFIILYYSAVEIVANMIIIRSTRKITVLDQLIISFCFWLCYPLVVIFRIIITGMKKHLEIDDAYFVTLAEKKIMGMTDIQTNPDALKQDEREMIGSIFELRDTIAKEIMIPRIDVFAVEEQTPVREIMQQAREYGHSRIPVYRETIDNIIGILYIKDLFLRDQDAGPLVISSILRTPFFVPETKKINDLMKEFKTNKIHLAVVVDEYGGTAGLITLEDVLEEIVGDIQDEYDEDEFIYKQLAPNAYLINGTMNIEELNEKLKLELPYEDFDTLAGFIFDQLGAVPEKGQKFTFRNMIFIIDELIGKRISKVRIIIKDSGSEL